MKVAVCGNVATVQNILYELAQRGVEVKFFIRDMLHVGETAPDNIPHTNFFGVRRLIAAGELDGVVIAERPPYSFFAESVVGKCKLYNIPNVGVCYPQGIYWLESSKIFVPSLEADITDKCNLHCAGCYHFANFSVAEDFYPIENFRRDMSRIAQTCDVLEFHLLGGEPLFLKNLDKYLIVARQCLPNSDLRILTNGTLILSLPQKILNAVRENRFTIDISPYPPTMKIVDKIKAVLDANKIKYTFMSGNLIRYFFVFMTLHGSNNPEKSRQICMNNTCRAMRDGKIYKCPPDAFSYKFTERFGIEGFPQSVGVDIYAPNFSSLLDGLDGNVEMCYWCSERVRQIPWQPTNNPKLEDWLADPDELKNFF